MTTEVEGEVLALTVVEPREMLADTATPEGTVSLATRMATALKDIVEKQKLYAVIQGKKFPQVEAWMTIARMDNVVAREVAHGITRHEDGSYEAEVELIRLSDGMVIGYGSALCGSKGDRPWDARPEPARRSMAVTRATSRAFRQQYSWIMALAGYEPTPADEMPQDERPLGTYDTPPARPPLVRTTHEGGLVGVAERGKAKGKDADGNPKGPPAETQFDLRQDKDNGHRIGFRLTQGRKGYKVLAFGQLAYDLAEHDLIGQRVTCWGTLHDETFVNDENRTIEYQVLHLERITFEGVELPAPTEAATVPMGLVDDDLSDLDF